MFGVCVTLSRTGKLPPRQEDNAHKRLMEGASGADVFHEALNGAAEICVCAWSLHAYEWDGNERPRYVCL